MNADGNGVTKRLDYASVATSMAEDLRNSPRLKHLGLYRLRVEEQGAPEWFIRLLDVEIRLILFNIDYLAHWSHNSDPAALFERTRQTISMIHLVARACYQPSMLLHYSTTGVNEWLQSLQENGKE